MILGERKEVKYPTEKKWWFAIFPTIIGWKEDEAIWIWLKWYQYQQTSEYYRERTYKEHSHKFPTANLEF